MVLRVWGPRLGNILSDFRWLFRYTGSRIRQCEHINLADIGRCVWCVSRCEELDKIVVVMGVQRFPRVFSEEEYLRRV